MGLKGCVGRRNCLCHRVLDPQALLLQAPAAASIVRELFPDQAVALPCRQPRYTSGRPPVAEEEFTVSYLHVLVAVPYDDEGRKISGFLQRRNCRVQVRTDGDHALQAVRDAMGQQDPYDLVLADYRIHNLDGLSLIGEIHRLDPQTVCCLIAEGHRLDEAGHAEARRLGCRHALAKPLDYGKVQRIVERLHRQKSGGRLEPDESGGYTPHSGTNRTGSGRSDIGTGRADVGTGRSRTGDDTPFFGTRRLSGTGRIGSGGHHSVADDQVERVSDSAALPIDPFEEQLPRSPSRPQDPQTGHTHDRHRRAIQGAYEPHNRSFDPVTHQPRKEPMTGAFDEPSSNASPTQRIRRGVTGRIKRDSQQEQEEVKAHTARITRAAIQVACTHCGERFSVVRKPEPYTMPCIHCGGVNSIAPG